MRERPQQERQQGESVSLERSYFGAWADKLMEI